MIKILQAGQSGASKYLIDMHRVRTQIFRDRMGWDVNVNHLELEIDEYDLPETIYILSIDDKDKVNGVWRFLMTDQPSMIKDVWPQYLNSLPIPSCGYMCETSRFGVLCDKQDSLEYQRTVNCITAQMLLALIDVSIKCGITDMYTLYNIKIKRLLERIGFVPYRTSEIIDLEGHPTVTAHFKMNEELYNRIRTITNKEVRIPVNDLPPLLLEKFFERLVPHEERRHANTA